MGPRRISSSALAGVGLAILVVCSACSATPSAPTDVAQQEVAQVASSHRLLAVMRVPIGLDPPGGYPVLDLKPGLATWRAAIDAEDAIRVLTPVDRDGRSATDPHAALLALRDSGVRIVDDRTVDIGGHRGRVFTVTTSRTVPAGLGCWSSAVESCFDVPTGLTLRVATVVVQDRPIVLWARTSTAHPSALIVAAFERMLRTVTVGR